MIQAQLISQAYYTTTQTTEGEKKKIQHIRNSSGHATAPCYACSSATPSCTLACFQILGLNLVPT